mmetsp:Transcript_21370/g.87289  ORF Transcript_21370/g.87289 Transcript_21370/m.87289 type:complete len:133 (-) Transcript_21370:308-706(-)
MEKGITLLKQRPRGAQSYAVEACLILRIQILSGSAGWLLKAAKRFCLGPNVGDFEEMELQTGVPQSFIRVQDSASIAKAVHRLLLDPDSLRDAGREIQDSVRKLGRQAKEAIVENLVPLLNGDVAHKRFVSK